MSLEVWIGIAGILSPVLIGIVVLIFRTGRLDARVESMIVPVSKIIEMHVKVEELWRERTTIKKSPIALNVHGKKILNDTKIQTFTDKYFDQIVEEVDKLNPRNAYEAQECLINVMQGFKNNPLFKDELEKISFKSPLNLNTILFVGAVNIRDEVIKRLSFRREDIDRFDPNKP